MSLAAFDNWVLWAILLLGLGAYQLLWYWILCARAGESQDEAGHWIGALQLLIGALPLLGLLGTITGLLDTFFAMSLGRNLDQSELLSSGIADALLTTQFGLAMAVPAWLLHAYLRHLFRRNQHIAAFEKAEHEHRALTDATAAISSSNKAPVPKGKPAASPAQRTATSPTDRKKLYAT